MNDDGTKTCSLCKEAKPAAEFWANTKSRDGLHSRCKDCCRTKSAEWKRSHPEKVKEYAADWRKRNPEKMKRWDREQYLKDPKAWNARQAAYSRRWKAENPERHERQRRERWLRMKYGIDVADYERLLAQQGGVCAICKGHQSGKQRRYLAVDHCHSTGRVRGLLCDRCNLTVGRYEDDPELFDATAAYLRRPDPLTNNSDVIYRDESGASQAL